MTIGFYCAIFDKFTRLYTQPNIIDTPESAKRSFMQLIDRELKKEQRDLPVLDWQLVLLGRFSAKDGIIADKRVLVDVQAWVNSQKDPFFDKFKAGELHFDDVSDEEFTSKLAEVDDVVEHLTFDEV